MQEDVNVKDFEELIALQGFTKFALVAYAFKSGVLSKEEFREYFRRAKEFAWAELK